MLEQLKTFIFTNSHFERFLHFCIEYALIYNILRDTALRGGQESFHVGLKSDLVSVGVFCYLNSP